ncbi:DedA family protein [Phorcysia thermohydrogeniphila]|uniref:Membrane-associated protein n=1 Tax=Phorcysia thermohydrogeniphila TaxID=936138 RepID=A0A4R1GC06_9BACT|nr:DedA family protein [Phorcysia thermohydrogeniphila]TCK05348.1 membrane-associated protein [Phorcysia thermohydrogeniphila]
MELGSLVEVSTQFIKSHPELACFFLFLWAFLETGLLLGLLLPAEKILIVGSVLASKGVIPPSSFLICASFGTVLGYTVSYLAGYFLGEEPLKKYLSFLKVSREDFERVGKLIRRRGELTVVFGRFIPVVRAVLPVVIGAFRPPFWKFTLYNVIGALLWVLSYLVVGNLIGEFFSFIIKHKLIGVTVLSAALLLYFFWRRYGKNKKLL